MDSINHIISSDKEKINIPLVHSILTNSYWAKGRTLEQVKKSIDNSICFGLYHNDEQIGFARIITDKVVFAYIMDVFIIKVERGKGYSKELMEYILSQSDLQGIKTWFLATKDAHGLYEQFGFKTVTETNKWMKKQTRGNQ